MLLAALAIGTLFVVGAFAWSSPADAQGLDLCDLLGDPYCPDGPNTDPGGITCSDGAPIGDTGTCSLDNVDVGAASGRGIVVVARAFERTIGVDLHGSQ